MGTSRHYLPSRPLEVLLMVRLSRWCFEHRRRVAAGWQLALVVVVGLSQVLGSKYSSDFSLPGIDSQAAVMC